MKFFKATTKRQSGYESFEATGAIVSQDVERHIAIQFAMLFRRNFILRQQSETRAWLAFFIQDFANKGSLCIEESVSEILREEFSNRSRERCFSLNFDRVWENKRNYCAWTNMRNATTGKRERFSDTRIVSETRDFVEHALQISFLGISIDLWVLYPVFLNVTFFTLAGAITILHEFKHPIRS